MRLVTRSEWGAGPAKAVTRLAADRVGMLVLHHTTGDYLGPSTIRGIQAFHQGPQRGWADIAYNFLVAPDGTVFVGRGWEAQGAHAKGHNSRSVGIAYVGDGRRPVPVEAMQAIVQLAAEADTRFGSLRRVGHRDVGSTVCPGDLLYRWWVSGAALPVAMPQEPPVAPSATEGAAGVVVPEEAEVAACAITERPRAFGGGPTLGPRVGGTALPALPKGLRWGSGGLPRIPWLRGGA